MFGNESLPGRVYKYVAKEPAEGLGAVEEQLRAAHRYRNTLVHLERKRRRQVEEAILGLYPELAELKAALDAAQAACDAIVVAVKTKNQTQRKRQASPADRQALAAARQTRRDAAAAFKAAKARAFADPEVKTGLKTIEDEHKTALKAARKHSGLYWGTYLFIEQSLQGIRAGTPPEFERWTAERFFGTGAEADLPVLGEGAVVVQVQGGLSWDEVLGGQDQRVRIQVSAGPPRAIPGSARSREACHGVCWLRVGSEGRAPVWAKIPFWLHRMPPLGVQVKWVRLHRRLVGGRAEWSLQFVLTAAQWERPGQAETGECGIDLGWRKVPEGLRVAVLADAEERTRMLHVPQAWIDKLQHARSLRAIADRNFDAARDQLKAWLLEQATLPDYLEQIRPHLHLWKSAEKLAAVIVHWRDRRFPDDQAIFTAMDAWRKQDKHLRQWECAEAGKVTTWRNALYRKFAKEVASTYATVRVEDMDIKDLKALPGPLEADQPYARVYANLAAPGILRRFLEEAARRFERVPAALTTQCCHACGVRNTFDAAASIHWTCTACGVRWDQDVNAARWIRGGGVVPATA